MLFTPSNQDSLEPVRLVFTGENIISLVMTLKQRLLVLVRTDSVRTTSLRRF